MNVKKEMKKFEKKVDREFEEVEQWIVERKKFLIKLGWVAGIIIVLLVVSHLYLRTKGFG